MSVTSFEGMAAFTDQRLNLTGAGEAEEVTVQFATPSLFNVLGVQPMLGRTLTEADGDTNAPNVVILRYDFWQRRFGGDPQLVGKPILLNDTPFTVIGIMPQGFQWHIKQRSDTGRQAENLVGTGHAHRRGAGRGRLTEI